MSELHGRSPVPAHQADATLSQANPVSATLYTVLDTTVNVRILIIATDCTWTVQPSPLEIVITIDGQTYTAQQANPVSTTDYCLHWRHGVDVADFYMDGNIVTNVPLMLEGRSVRVQVRITGGTVQNLSARVKWARW